MNEIPCPKCDEGHIEISSKIYYDVTGRMIGDRIVIDTIEPSDVNDLVDDQPVNLESELTVSCNDCGAEFTDFTFDTGLVVNPQSSR